MINSRNQNIALLGNGHNKELSEDQFTMIQKLYENVKPLRDQLKKRIELNCAEKDKYIFCDHETCRRYLVARNWNIKTAEKQLVSTLSWRIKQIPGLICLEFWQSPKAIENPFALNMRCVGLDKEEHPVTYTCFAEAHDRFDTPAVIAHVTLLLESLMKLLKKRQSRGFNQTAESRQWVWLIDFDGFSFRDNNPKLGFRVIKLLMDNYPELLNLMVFVNAPYAFSSTWKIARPLLDDKVRSKILFVRGDTAIKENLVERLGDQVTKWLLQEMKDNQLQRMNESSRGYKKYWNFDENGDHDPRGIKSYVNSDSDYYIITPGDAYEKKYNDDNNS